MVGTLAAITLYRHKFSGQTRVTTKGNYTVATLVPTGASGRLFVAALEDSADGRTRTAERELLGEKDACQTTMENGEIAAVLGRAARLFRIAPPSARGGETFPSLVQGVRSMTIHYAPFENNVTADSNDYMAMV